MRSEKSRKLLEDGKIWKDSNLNKWCRKCPTCLGNIPSSCFNTCLQLIDKRCDACSRINSHRKRGIVAQGFIDQKLIWSNETGNWCRRCPQCSCIVECNSINNCLSNQRKNTLCFRCARKMHSGVNHSFYGTHLSEHTKEKISHALTGKTYKPLSDSHRNKIRESMRKNSSRLLGGDGINQYKWKKYIFSNGREELVQGYEPWTLDMLTQNGIQESDILIGKGNRPIIKYDWSGSVCHYLPDCYIPSSNTLVETKSGWTWNKNLSQNIAKISGSIQSGFNVRVVIWNPSHILTSDVTYTLKNNS